MYWDDLDCICFIFFSQPFKDHTWTQGPAILLDWLKYEILSLFPFFFHLGVISNLQWIHPRILWFTAWSRSNGTSISAVFWIWLNLIRWLKWVWIRFCWIQRNLGYRPSIIMVICAGFTSRDKYKAFFIEILFHLEDAMSLAKKFGYGRVLFKMKEGLATV